MLRFRSSLLNPTAFSRFISKPMKSNMSQYFAAGRTGLLFAGLAFISLLTGCVTREPEMSSGTPIESAKVTQIVKGKTTRAEIEGLFGKPDMTSMLPDGRRMIAYNYSSTHMKVNSGAILRAAFTASGSLAQGTTKTQALQIYLSKDGIVEDYEFNDNTRDIQSFGDGSMKTNTR